jgi:hypothetical protein
MGQLIGLAGYAALFATLLFMPAGTVEGSGRASSLGYGDPALHEMLE